MSVATKPLVGSQSNECLVCEHSNDVEYWDTGRYLDLPWPNKHEGRKFVCRDCVNDAAQLFGFLSPESAKLLKDRNDYLESQLVYENKVDQLIAQVQAASAEIAKPDVAAPAPFAPAVPDSVNVEVETAVAPKKSSKKSVVVDDSTQTT